MPKILILAPTFFPHRAVSAVRVTQWARHLPEFGWQPLVLARHRGYSTTAQEMAERLHPDVRLEYLGKGEGARRKAEVVRPQPTANSRQPTPTSWRDAFKRTLDIVSVPDVVVWRWRSLYGQALALAREWQPDVVLSSSPPHSIHMLGRRLAKATGAAWVVDFRDPYLIDIRYQPRGLKRALYWRHRQFEQAVYRDAALILHAIPFHARWAMRRYPWAADKIRTLTNGIPSELLQAGKLEQEAAEAGRGKAEGGAGRVSIRTVGVLGHGAVFAIAAALRQLVEWGIDAEFRQVGPARDAAELIPDDLRDRLHLLGRVPHEEALRMVAGADVLLKYDDLERAKVSGLSSKLFEYLATGRPIVAVNPTRADWQLLGRLPWCSCLADPQPTAMAEALRQAITSQTHAPDEWLHTFRQQYNRRNQTKQLADWLDALPAEVGRG